MTLRDNLYTTLRCEQDGQAFTFAIRLNQECFIYKAHFPGNPITPGVCILQIATELAEEKLERKMQLAMVNNVKFLAILSPTENPEVEYVFAEPTINGTEARLKVVVKNSTTTFAKISLTYNIL